MKKFSISLILFIFLINIGFASKVYSQTPGQIGTGTGTSTSLPIYSYYKYSYSQQIYTTAEVSAAIGTATYITAIKFYTATVSTPQHACNDWVVYMGNTSQNNFASSTSWVPVSSLTEVFSGTIPHMTSGSWVTVHLSTPFIWNGTDNLVIAVNERSPSRHASSMAWGSYNAGPKRGIHYHASTSNPNPAAPRPASSRYSHIPRLQLVSEILQPCAIMPPANIAVGNLTITSANVTWITAIGATYVLRYRAVSGGIWQEIPVNTSLAGNQLLTNLEELTEYEVQIASICGGTQSAFSSSTTFTTPAVSHCPAGSTSPVVDGYISQVEVIGTGTASMVSNSEFNNYTDYSTDPTRLVTLVRGSTNNTVTITKAWPDYKYSFSTGVWIDFNRNGIFEANEKILTSPNNNTSPVSVTFQVPAAPNVYGGGLRTRMRVGLEQSYPISACGLFLQGEVEDYDVQLIDLAACTTAPPVNIGINHVERTSANVTWTSATDTNYVVRYKAVSSAVWHQISVNTPLISNLLLTNLLEQTQYEVQIATVCGGTQGGFSSSVTFTTPALAYCPMEGTGTNNHISNVTVTSSNLTAPVMSNTSVQTKYISYTTPETLITLDITSQNNKISVTKDWTGSTTNDAVAAWIDFNRNGQFDASEQILASPASNTNPVTGTFALPATVYSGPLTTTMRVVTKRTSSPIMCKNVVNGEVEDYRVRLRPCSNATPGTPMIVAAHNAATIAWTGVTNNVTFLVRYRVQGTTGWTTLYTSALSGNNSIVVNGLTPATVYEVQVSAVCGDTIGTFTPIETFVTRCDPAPPDVTINTITSTTALISWSPLTVNASYIMRWRKVGTTGWLNAQINLPAAPAHTYVLGSVIPLEPYTNYEVQIANQCVGESTPNLFSNPKVFTTERICEQAPTGLTITQLLPASAEIKWDSFPGATYILRYRKVGIPSWTKIPTPANNLVLNGLTELARYEIQVANICNGTPGIYTPLYYFTTPTVIYCPMSSASPSGEYIAKVTVKPNGKPMMENASGASTYTDYTGASGKSIEMIQGSTDNQIIIEKKWTGNQYNEGIAVWIDFNRNGEFDFNERVFASPANTNSLVSGMFNVPADAFVSMTDYKYVVMRVAMQRDGIPVNCVNFGNGEVEDYTVRISKKGIPNPTNQTDISIYPNPVSSILYVKNIGKRAKYKIYNAAGQVIAEGILLNNQINISKLINGVYVIDIDDHNTTAQKKFIKE